MSYERAKELFTKYKNEMATDEEKALVEKWLFGYNNEPGELSDEKIESISREVWSRLPQPVLSPIHRLTVWTKVAAAASVILALSFGGYFLLKEKRSQQMAYYKNDIPPGHNQATLTLANGKKIILVKGLSGTLAQQGNTQIGVNGQSAIAYTATVANVNQPVAYNTLSTAVGEQSPYPLILPDGSKVWLNAQSSITFPTAFNGKERIVRITGEALFEVAHNAEHPFKVQTEKQTIEDIGTTFDVNAYADETATKTTLIEGKVKVNNMFLEPGQQSDGTHIKTVDTRRYTAWRNGDFYFEDDNIQTVMRELSRWYSVKINYEGDVTTEGFDAQISRNKNISAVLQILENTKGVHFKIEGRRVTVIE
jgi:transmembrane sensor